MTANPALVVVKADCRCLRCGIDSSHRRSAGSEFDSPLPGPARQLQRSAEGCEPLQRGQELSRAFNSSSAMGPGCQAERHEPGGQPSPTPGNAYRGVGPEVTHTESARGGMGASTRPSLLLAALCCPYEYRDEMSVDLVATLEKPVTLDAVLQSGRQVLADLLGVAAPELVVVVDREYRQGVRLGGGRQLAVAELRETVIGHRIPAADNGFAESIHFEIDIPATGDGVFLMMIDYQGDGPDDELHAVFSPYRTCVGVAVAAGLALTTARLGHGRYVDEEIGMITPSENDPDDVIDRTRLSEAGEDFAVQCEKYVRQFRHLNGWPRNRAMHLQ